MSIQTAAILLSIFLFSCETPRTVYTEDQLTGSFTGTECSNCEDHGGWEAGLRDYMELELFADSTYNDIHESRSAFDLMDYWGTWSVHNDSIVLVPKGRLEWENSLYVRRTIAEPLDTNGCNAIRLLTIEDADHLIIRDCCSKTEAVLQR